MSPVLQFENRLRKVVRSFSKKNYGEEVSEVTKHFEDIHNEALSIGLVEPYATKETYRRIGRIGTIARSIVHSSDRAELGRRLQWLGVALWISVQIAYELLCWNVHLLNDQIFQWATVLTPWKMSVFAGALWAIGVFRSSKVFKGPAVAGGAWLLVAWLTSTILLSYRPESDLSNYIVFRILIGRALMLGVGFCAWTLISRVQAYRFDIVRL